MRLDCVLRCGSRAKDEWSCARLTEWWSLLNKEIIVLIYILWSYHSFTLQEVLEYDASFQWYTYQATTLGSFFKNLCAFNFFFFLQRNGRKLMQLRHSTRIGFLIDGWCLLINSIELDQEDDVKYDRWNFLQIKYLKVSPPIVIAFQYIPLT